MRTNHGEFLTLVAPIAPRGVLISSVRLRVMTPNFFLAGIMQKSDCNMDFRDPDDCCVTILLGLNLIRRN